MANKHRSQLGITYKGKEVVLSLCMENLELLEERLGMGLFDYFAAFEQKRKEGSTLPLTIKDSLLIIESASSKKMKKKDVQKWADDNGGLVILAETATELLTRIVPDDKKQEVSTKKKYQKDRSLGKNG